MYMYIFSYNVHVYAHGLLLILNYFSVSCYSEKPIRSGVSVSSTTPSEGDASPSSRPRAPPMPAQTPPTNQSTPPPKAQTQAPVHQRPVVKKCET